MCEIVRHRESAGNRRRGIALLMVLLIVLAVAVLSAGFIAQADVELASGNNMLLHAQTDQLAFSGLEHAKGLLLRPHLVSSTQIDANDFYWTGAASNLLFVGSNDAYDVAIARDATDACTYQVACEAYREKAGERIGQTRLTAQLRLDPCIALWSKTDATVRQNWLVQGDVCTVGALTNQAPAASLDGDVFATQLTGAAMGQRYPISNLTVTWPGVTETFFSPSNLPITVTTATMSGTYSSTPRRVYKRAGDLVLAPGTKIDGMLLVTGSLTVTTAEGLGCSIAPARNLPALYVKGDLTLDSVSGLTVTGLAVVDGNLRISSDTSNVKFLGGLYVGGAIAETTADASGNGLAGTLCGNPTWDTSGALGRALRFDGVDDSVACGNSALLDLTTGLTAAAWVKSTRTDLTGVQILAAKSGAYSLAIQANALVFSIYSDSAAAWQVVSYTLGATFNNAWHHVAGTFDGDVASLYVDGVLRGSTAYAGTIASRPANSLLLASDGACFFQGVLDDVRIYSRALLAAEIGQIKTGMAVADLVAQWPLNGPGSGVTIAADPTRGAVIINGTTYWSPAGGAFFRNIERQ